MVLVMVYPNFNKPFILYMNVLEEGIEIILYQKGNNKRKQIIAYISRTFNEYKNKYLITKQKYLTVI